MRTRLSSLPLVAAGVCLLAACGEPTAPADDDALPALLSEFVGDGAGENYFEPGWQLWTNGSVKRRTIELRAGGEISTAVRSAWSFPEGTTFLKTFSYLTQASPTTPVPVETRVIRMRDGKWETGVWRWRADGSDAELLDGATPVSVAVTDKDGRTINHLIPSKGQCQVCHGSNPTFIIGFTELQLNSTLPGENTTQLQKFFQSGLLGGTIPASPAGIVASDTPTRTVLGYVQGNCVHCHNVNSALNLTPATFLANTVNKTGPSNLILITPQDPDNSLIYVRFSNGQMPALGVQLGDSAARAMLREWILTHDFGN